MKLHIGCGKRNFGSDWIHIDGAIFPHISWHDITKLPYDPDTVDLIYASHVLEYFDREEVIVVLDEWKRVLKKEGVLRLAVPDFESMANLYVENKFQLKSFLGPLYGKMKLNEYSIYHKTVYDYKSIKDVLEQIGFRGVVRYDWKTTSHADIDDHSQAYLPHMDKENGVLISLNVECVK